MITMRIKGGLGNQLFQYAAAYAMARRLNQPFQFNPAFSDNMTPRGYKLSQLSVLSDSIVSEQDLPRKVNMIKGKYLNKFFRITNQSKHKCGEYLYWLETRDEWQPDFFEIDYPNLYVDGYFQSYKYFSQFRQELLDQFQPSYTPENEYLEVLEEIKSKNAVAVHVRRGDFTKTGHRFHYLLSEEYYKRGLRYMREKLQNPTFFWFSDDIDWVKKTIGESDDFSFIRLSTKHADIDEMMLMKNCKHIITANSTFSWWAAWLNENENSLQIVPEKPFGMPGMIPDNWIKM